MNRLIRGVVRATPVFALPVALAMLGGCTLQSPRPEDAQAVAAAAAGIDNGRGACIGGAQGADSCAFAIGILDDDKEQPVAVLSRELIDYDDSGHPNWKVKDRIAVPRTRGDLHLEQSSCRFDGAADETIVALVPAYDERGAEWIGAQEWAYRVQLPAGKFVRLAPEKVDCRNTAAEAE